MGEYVKCRDCQATYNEVIQAGSVAVSVVDAKTGGAPRPGRETTSKVSGHVLRRAQKTREAAKAERSPKVGAGQS